MVTAGQDLEPLKWPQRPFASITSWKQMANIVQFNPIDWSLGTDEGRRLVVTVVMVDIVAMSGPITYKFSSA